MLSWPALSRTQPLCPLSLSDNYCIHGIQINLYRLPQIGGEDFFRVKDDDGK